MKTKLTILFLALAFICNAQSLKFSFENINDVRQTTDSIVSGAKRTFKFLSISRERRRIEKTSFIVKYVNANDSTDIIPVLIRTAKIGENKDLEIKGTVQYSVKFTQGRFLDLFPFWKKFINKNADEHKIVEIGYQSFDIGDNHLMFKKVGESIWTISM